MSWLTAAETTERTGGLFLKLANDKDVVKMMILDQVPAQCTKQATKFGTEEKYTKTVWVAHVVNMDNNEVQLWEIGPKHFKYVGVDLDGTDVSKSVYTITRYGAKGDQRTKYKVKMVGQHTALDAQNYGYGQAARKDLQSLGYTVLAPAVLAEALPF